MELGMWSSVIIVTDLASSCVSRRVDRQAVREKRWERRAASGDKEAARLLEAARSAVVHESSAVRECCRLLRAGRSPLGSCTSLSLTPVQRWRVAGRTAGMSIALGLLSLIFYAAPLRRTGSGADARCKRSCCGPRVGCVLAILWRRASLPPSAPDLCHRRPVAVPMPRKIALAGGRTGRSLRPGGGAHGARHDADRLLPRTSGALAVVAAALGALWYLLNRKPKIVREAEQRLGQLRDERGTSYNVLRPPH